MTLHSNVVRFAHLSKKLCSEAECDLPELKDDNMRAVRIKIKADCESSHQRLLDIGHQLEDAIEDWRRFIVANCQGDECGRIFEALRQRQQRLLIDVAQCQIPDNIAAIGPNNPMDRSGGSTAS